MAYRALYRVFRPQTFEDVVGQEVITRTLQNALLHEKVSHAYLFTGPRGTGKTSAAKIFAKALNCVHAPVAEPCNECDICLGITEGTIDDVLEIDAASNNGVDEIRDLREKVKYAPSRAKYKVYIIDEVHMLSTGAFNALLKTLEEPPKHVIFILATTEPHKIPLTIISRCQRFDFRKIQSESMLHRMNFIVAEENVDIEDEALKYIAMISEGGMRDALSILDQSISYSEGKVTLDDVLSITGGMNQNTLVELGEAIFNQDTTNALLLLDDLFKEGKEPTQMIEQLLHFYRDVLVSKSVKQDFSLLGRTIPTEQFLAFLENVNVSAIYPLLTILNRGIEEVKYSQHPRTMVEMTIIQMCQGETGVQVAQGNGQSTNVSIEGYDRKLEELTLQIQRLSEQGVENRAADNRNAQKPRRTPTKSEYEANETYLFQILKKATRSNLEKLKQVWDKTGDYFRSHNLSSLQALISNTEIVAASDTHFVLMFSFPIHAMMVAQNEDMSNNIQLFMKQMTGNPYEVVPISAEQWYKIREDFFKKDFPKDEVEQEEIPNYKPQAQPEIVTEAIRLFGEELVEIHED